MPRQPKKVVTITQVKDQPLRQSETSNVSVKTNQMGY